MIVVAGASGRLGTQLVTRLAARGLTVRALTRDPTRARHLAGSVAEVVAADVRDRASLQSALRGATTVVSAVQGFAGRGRVSPASVDRDGNANLIDAAVAARADVILVSVVGASPEHPMELFRAKHAAEEYLRASTARWTIVRATAFVELWADIMVKPIVFGRGDNPINFVSVHDVASVVERAVVDTGLRQRVIEIGGPGNATFNELAALLLQARAEDGRVRHIPPWLLRATAPFSRRVRAALAMDTIDMTFTTAATHNALADMPLTDLQTALKQAVT